MMKKLLFLTTLSAVANLGIGQTITSNDLQVPGKIYQLGVNTSVAKNISVGGKGTGQNWDYSALTQESSENVGTLIPSTTTYSSAFPGTSNATITEDSDGKTYSYYTVSPTKVEVTGVAYEATQLPGNPSAILKTIKALNFYETLPIALGNKTYSKGTYFGKAKYSPYPGVDSLEITMVIEKWDTVDASGQIKLPSIVNVNSYNVIRLKTQLKRTITVRVYLSSGSWITPPAPYDKPNVAEEVNYNFWAVGIGNEVCQVHYDSPSATMPASVKWFLNSTTGLESENASLNGLFISPNPATSQIRLNGYEGSYDLSIHTLQGKNVMNKKTMNGDQTLDVSDLTSGIYVITVETANGTKTKRKFVIQ